MNKQEFIEKGFSVIDGTQNNENKLLKFIKENYPSIIKDNEINLQELKAALGLPIDEKVNGYGLNFVGRNFARAKYTQKTSKEVKLNLERSKDFHTTQNLVLKGDNLDCLKILKHYYTGKIKCIYIDPPYNTDSDQFIYPDKFDREEAEALGFQNLSEDDFARMEFSFKTKKSHNGWLSFMYPRLLLARDLLSKDGVIFISIDDNEQANLKLLCDEIFGEENFVGDLIRKTKSMTGDKKYGFNLQHETVVCYAKNINNIFMNGEAKSYDNYANLDDDPSGDWTVGDPSAKSGGPSLYFPIINPYTKKVDLPPKGRYWAFSKETFEKYLKIGKIKFKLEHSEKERGFIFKRYKKELQTDRNPVNSLDFCGNLYMNQAGTVELRSLLQEDIFPNPKPSNFIKKLIYYTTSSDDIILDFFAGSGTTAHAVMSLNAEDASTGSAAGNRKFILCQIDEPIKEDKPAYKFCVDNNLPPVISSITIERLKRAGEKIKKELEEKNKQKENELKFENKDVEQVRSIDIGFKTFDLVDAPRLQVDKKGQIEFPEITSDSLSRIYNMIFTVGLDEPTQVPEEVVKDCIYKIGNHYYITNSQDITKKQLAECIKNGQVFIDGWTASLSSTLEHYKENVKIVF